MIKLWARIKDKFTTRVPVLTYSPGICPSCGAQIEIPMSRDVTRSVCNICQTAFYSVGVGIVDANKYRLKYVYDEVVFWVRANSAEYTQMAGEKRKERLQ